MRFEQKGFSVIGVMLILLVFGIVGFAGWRVYEQADTKNLTGVPTGDDAPPADGFRRIVAVGDIVCDPQDSHITSPDENYCQDEKVVQLVKKINPDAILALGDLQYNDGTIEKFQSTFSKNWSDFKKILYPTPGNHEYAMPQASGYHTYFKDSPVDISKGYYSFKLGAWKMFSLNSNCEKIGGCSGDSEQLKWLEAELAKNQTACSLAFWHHPRFTSGKYFGSASTKSRSDAFWPKLSAHKTDIVLSGHDHAYERFAPQSVDGQPSADGPRQFIAGTGGKSHYKRTGLAANSEKIIDDQFGVLVLDLYPNYYKWEFKNTDAAVLDSGRGNCNK